MLRRARIIRGYSPQYVDPLRAAAGERLIVGREDPEFPGWKWCKGPDGREGWVPVELLSDAGAGACIMNDCSARELAAMPGEEVTVDDARHGWLLVRNKEGDRGWIPASHTEPL
jgi:SH3-like domain-containing protein